MIMFSLIPNRKWKSKTGDANRAEKGYPVSMRNDVCLTPHYLSSLQTKSGSREGLSDFFESGAYRLKANEKRGRQSPDAMARMRSQEVIFSFNPVLQVVFCTAWMRKIIHVFLGHLAASCLMCLQAKQQGWWARKQTISKGKNLESIPDSPLPFSFPSVLCAFSLLPFFHRIWTLSKQDHMPPESTLNLLTNLSLFYNRPWMVWGLWFLADSFFLYSCGLSPLSLRPHFFVLCKPQWSSLDSQWFRVIEEHPTLYRLHHQQTLKMPRLFCELPRACSHCLKGKPFSIPEDPTILMMQWEDLKPKSLFPHTI